MCLQAAEDVSTQLALVKSMLCGSGDVEPQSEVTAQLSQEIYNANLLEQLVTDLAKIDFEVSSQNNHAIVCCQCHCMLLLGTTGYSNRTSFRTGVRLSMQTPRAPLFRPGSQQPDIEAKTAPDLISATDPSRGTHSGVQIS